MEGMAGKHPASGVSLRVGLPANPLISFTAVVFHDGEAQTHKEGEKKRRIKYGDKTTIPHTIVLTPVETLFFC